MTREEAVRANIYVHSSLVNAGEYEKSPHFLPENKEKVREILLQVTQPFSKQLNRKAIDFGCGTGFMIDLMKDLFAEVHGVDITPDMMSKVDLTSGNVFLHECLAENTPFPSNHFDFATAYSFMDHLFNYEDFLKEAFRVLKPNGVFYSDLNPNRAFIAAMDRAEKMGVDEPSAIVAREIKGALHNGNYYEENFGIDGELLNKAEPIKSIDKGFDAAEVVKVARAIGFSDCKVQYAWFLGQAKIMHEQTNENLKIISEYLTSTLPVSSQLYKYLRFVFVK
jgi:ubiquinone/menaquinone biosynthesis C-methylase UbiE